MVCVNLMVGDPTSHILLTPITKLKNVSTIRALVLPVACWYPLKSCQQDTNQRDRENWRGRGTILMIGPAFWGIERCIYLVVAMVGTADRMHVPTASEGAQ